MEDSVFRPFTLCWNLEKSAVCLLDKLFEATSTARPFGRPLANVLHPLHHRCGLVQVVFQRCPYLKRMVDLISERRLCVSHVAFHVTLHKDTQKSWSTGLYSMWSWHAHQVKWPHDVSYFVSPNSNHMCFAHCRLWIISCKDHDQVLHFMCPWQLCGCTRITCSFTKRKGLTALCSRKKLEPLPELFFCSSDPPIHFVLVWNSRGPCASK